MPRRASDVRDSLTRKGMVQDQSHHKMYRKTVDGVITLVTRISHGKAEIHDQNLRLMANQCSLQAREFLELVDCTLTEQQWDELIGQRCADGRNPFMGRGRS